MTIERTEGWGSLDNANKAHYFTSDGRSLCKKWWAYGSPRWEKYQELGDKPDRGTCAACWKIAARKANKHPTESGE